MNSNIESISQDQKLTIGLESTRRGLYLSCWQMGDRFAHEIGFADGEFKSRVLSSLEGKSEDNWPVSPALQQAYKQQVKDCPAILAVGMSGTSHYSTSMLIAANGSSSELLIESACCAKSAGQEIRLGTRLRIAPEFVFKKTVNGGELTGQVKVAITVDPELCEISEIAPQIIEFRPVQIEKSGTTQWKYRFRLNW